MALMYHPQLGEILLCNYETGFIKPEMIKRRPVVVVSPRLRRRDKLVAVVPLSTTEPESIEQYHCEIVIDPPLPSPFEARKMWVKCDMIATVACSRLDRFKTARKSISASRHYISGHVGAVQLTAIRKAVLCGLGLATLTNYL